jgi:pSer/pThr/pTyr-binding forkhead associated (FHA) protein
MPDITFQVLEGVDKGRVFRNLPTPVTIGREEGNLLRLNDERVSRFHAKVQCDGGEVILTDLESTNGTRVNGNIVQIRRLRAGDRVCVGRSVLLFGSEAEIAERLTTLSGQSAVTGSHPSGAATPATLTASGLAAEFDHELDFDLNLHDKVSAVNGNLFLGNRPLPPLPLKLTPSQAARLSELLDFLHHQLGAATEMTRANEECTQVTLNYGDWQRILAVQMLLARYVRAISEPDALGD